MKIYVASHSIADAANMARLIEECGHICSATWMYNGLPMKTSENPEEIRPKIAKTDADEVLASDALVLLDSPDRVPGGKFVEVGIALGSEKRVFLVGRRENMLMWHPAVEQFASIDEFKKFLLGA